AKRGAAAFFAGAALTGAVGLAGACATGASIFGKAAGSGTGGPLEAGTLSEAGSPVPFGGRLKGIFAGVAVLEGAGATDSGLETGASACVNGIVDLEGRLVDVGTRTTFSGSASEIDLAVAGCTLIAGSSVVS